MRDFAKECQRILGTIALLRVVRMQPLQEALRRAHANTHLAGRTLDCESWQIVNVKRNIAALEHSINDIKNKIEHAEKTTLAEALIKYDR